MTELEKQQFIYLFEAVRPELVTDSDAWTEEDIRIGDQHFTHLRKATDEEKVILAGRSTDGKEPAFMVFEASSEEEARKFMESDPFVYGGLMRARLHPFRAALVRGS